jgi:AAA15 family ATPase/GTPase
MSKHFIKKISIKGFKCFDDFSSNNFQRVNFIGGKNNIGKTSFLEACYINTNSENIEKFINSLFNIKFSRENINLLFEGSRFSNKNLEKFIESSSGIFVETDIRKTGYQKENINGINKHTFSINNEVLEINIKKSSFSFSESKNTIGCTDFIDNFGKSNSEIIGSYSSIQKKDKEKRLDSILNNFDPNIKSFKIIENKPYCKVNNKYLEISELGDGTRHLISIVTSLYKCENGYLFIDEIDNGIHYTMLEDILEIILIVSKELNVQVFATTHSKECIESYGKAAKKSNNHDISFITLVRNRKEEIQAITYDYDLFMNNLEQNHEVRGW